MLNISYTLESKVAYHTTRPCKTGNTRACHAGPERTNAFTDSFSNFKPAFLSKPNKIEPTASGSTANGKPGGCWRTNPNARELTGQAWNACNARCCKRKPQEKGKNWPERNGAGKTLPPVRVISFRWTNDSFCPTQEKSEWRHDDENPQNDDAECEQKHNGEHGAGNDKRNDERQKRGAEQFIRAKTRFLLRQTRRGVRAERI